MASHIGVPAIDVRPSLSRSRSHSSPFQNLPSHPHSALETTSRPTRPTHGRSQSYLSPSDPKPRNAATLPTQGTHTHTSTLDKASSKLHLPVGKHHDHRHNKHRYTQSETEQHHRLRKQNDTDSLPNLVAGLAAERQRREREHAGHEVAVPGGLTRMMSTRSYRADTVDRYGRPDIRRRATSDPRAPPRPQQRNTGAIEAELERAERVKRQRKFTVTAADVARKDAQIQEAEEEMRGLIAEVNGKGIEITRRLDYGYYNLLEKVGGLISTIQSFQSLSRQSAALVGNFEAESRRLDGDIRGRVERFKTGFEEREERVARLQVRGKEVASKAEDLGRRMDNMSVLLENWKRREEKVQRAWGRFWGGVIWGVSMVCVCVLAILLYKEWWFRGDVVKAGLGLPTSGHWNGSFALGEGSKGQQRVMALPEDVRAVLEGIEKRNRRRKDFFTPVSVGEDNTMQDEGEEKLRMLDDL